VSHKSVTEQIKLAYSTIVTQYAPYARQQGDASIRPRPVVGFTIISFFVHEIKRWLSRQPKGMSVFVLGH